MTESALNYRDFINVLPYLIVITLAAIGVHVFVALTLGIIAGGIIGYIYGYFDIIGFTKNIYNGFAGMNEIFILSMIIGGLAHMVNKEGGLRYILSKIETLINRKRVYGVIGLLIMAVDLAIANNTVTIIVASPLIQKLKDLYHLNAKKLASFMDIYACIAQGIIPYGAQVLLILSLSDNFGYLDLLKNSWYLLFLFLITSGYIIFLSREKAN